MRGVGETFFVSKQALRFLGPSAQGRRNARVKASLRSTSRNICMDGLFTSKPRMMWARTLYICGLKKGTVYGHVCNDHAGGPSMYIQIYIFIYLLPLTWHHTTDNLGVRLPQQFGRSEDVSNPTAQVSACFLLAMAHLTTSAHVSHCLERLWSGTIWGETIVKKVGTLGLLVGHDWNLMNHIPYQNENIDIWYYVVDIWYYQITSFPKWYYNSTSYLMPHKWKS